MWDPMNKQCKRRCETDYMQQGGVARCINDPMCLWNASSTPSCRRQCPFRYDSQVACTNDLGCIWSASAKSCKPACETYNASTKASCLAESACVFYDASGQCLPKCEPLTPQRCLLYPKTCEWLEGSKECRTLCTVYSGKTTCTADNRCEWDDQYGKINTNTNARCVKTYVSGDFLVCEGPTYMNRILATGSEGAYTFAKTAGEFGRLLGNYSFVKMDSADYTTGAYNAATKKYTQYNMAYMFDGTKWAAQLMSRYVGRLHQ